MALRSYHTNGRMEIFDAELWVMWIALKETAKEEKHCMHKECRMLRAKEKERRSSIVNRSKERK